MGAYDSPLRAAFNAMIAHSDACCARAIAAYQVGEAYARVATKD